MASLTTATASAKPVMQPQPDSKSLKAQKGAIKKSLKAITLNPDGTRTINHDRFLNAIFKDSSQLQNSNRKRIISIFAKGFSTQSVDALEAAMLQTLTRSKKMDEVLNTELFAKIMSFAGLYNFWVFSTKESRAQPHAAKLTKAFLSNVAKERLRESENRPTYRGLMQWQKLLGLENPAEAIAHCENAETLDFGTVTESQLRDLARFSKGLKKVSTLIIRRPIGSDSKYPIYPIDVVTRFKLDTITDISLYHHQFTSETIKKLAENFPQLTHLDLGDNPIDFATLKNLELFKNLQTLQFPEEWVLPDPESLRSILESIPQLKNFIIRRNPHITEAHLDVIANVYPNLEKLDITFCNKITAEGIRRAWSHRGITLGTHLSFIPVEKPAEASSAISSPLPPAYSSGSSSSSSSSSFGSGEAAPAFSVSSAAASSSSSTSLGLSEAEPARRELEELERDGF